MAEFREAPEVDEVGLDIMVRYHKHLVEAKIRYLYRLGKWESKGRIILGKAAKTSDREKYLTGTDFVITINFGAWQDLTPKEREALIDHELSHCEYDGTDERGERRWMIVPHDVEDFAHVVGRHGLWQPDLRRLAKAANEYRQGLFQFEVSSELGGKVVATITGRKADERNTA